MNYFTPFQIIEIGPLDEGYGARLAFACAMRRSAGSHHAMCRNLSHSALRVGSFQEPEAKEAIIEALEVFIATPNRVLEEHNPNFRRVFLVSRRKGGVERND